MSYTRVFNFIVLGDVGKSHFRRQFCEDHYNVQSKVKLGVEYGSRDEIIQGECIKINIWELASLASYRSLAKAYYHGATAGFLIFDVNNRSTFEGLNEWMEVIRWTLPDHSNFTLVATTTDPWKDRQVSTTEAKKFAEAHGLEFQDINTADKNDVEKLVISKAETVWSDIKAGKLDESDLINGVIVMKPATTGIARCF